MAVKIEQEITGYKVKPKGDDAPQVVEMNEKLERPNSLMGSTYKIKSPLGDSALYLTINDIVVDEKRVPFEIFINTKSNKHYQWVIAMTRLISSVFRKGGDVTFLVDELKEVFDPKGGYFKPGGKYVPSLVAEIGLVIEEHLKMLGLIKGVELDEHQQKLINEKRAEYEATRAKSESVLPKGGDPIYGAALCAKCNETAVIVKDGCATCLSCGDSKCG